MDPNTKLNPITSGQVAEVIHTGLYRGGPVISDAGELTFSDLAIRGHFQLTNGSEKIISHLHFLNCKFEDLVEWSNFSRITQISFENCIFSNKVHFKHIQLSIEFKNQCIFKDETVFEFNLNTANLAIADLILESKLCFNGRFAGSVTLRNINLARKKREGEIIFKKNVFKNVTVNVAYCRRINIIQGARIESEANFENIYADDFVLDGFKIGLIFRLLSSDLSNLSIDNISEHREIEIINTTIASEAKLAVGLLNRTLIRECPFINCLHLWGTNTEKHTFLTIEKVELKKLYFDKLYNEGIITLRELTIQSNGLLIINSSGLGRTDFIRCDFSKASLEFENSKIVDAFFSLTDFPNTVKINNDDDHAQAQLAFGQLHTAFQKQGDTVRALEYQAREIEAHYRTLKWFITKKKPYVNFTWLNLWLNKISNNFGRNWVRPMILSFVAGAIFFYALVLSSEEYYFGFPITLDDDLSIGFFRFMNPIRFFELDKLFNQPITLKASSFFWDFLGRVSIAYFFYQTIQAFRRYGRK